MAGGSGSRLWPASTIKNPKQFMKLPASDKMSFFGAAVERALAVTAGDGLVVIVAGENHVSHIVEECTQLETRDRNRIVLIPEPAAKNTAPAIACALVYLSQVFPGGERKNLVLTSDHIIEPLDAFKADAEAAAVLAEREKLVVFGIMPGRPDTGYGYIETTEALDVNQTFTVASFHEKPDLEKAKLFLASGNYFWNSGMFAFGLEFMLTEFRKSAPEVLASFEELPAPVDNFYSQKNGLRILENWDKLDEAYRNTKAISFDYAIAEKCSSAAMVRAGFSWADVGSWDEYARLNKTTSAEVYGSKDALDSCYVDSEIPVALCGVKDLIVVVRPGSDGEPPAILISKKGETQKVREVVEEIKTKGRNELL